MEKNASKLPMKDLFSVGGDCGKLDVWLSYLSIPMGQKHTILHELNYCYALTDLEFTMHGMTINIHSYKHLLHALCDGKIMAVVDVCVKMLPGTII